jgi:hypothetical protein
MNAIVTWLKFAVVCNPGMNFMEVNAFLLKGWFSSLNVLCELVSNRKSSSSLSSARESVTYTCYPRFKNMKWFWQDKHDRYVLLEKPWLNLKWLHFRLTLIPLLIHTTRHMCVFHDQCTLTNDVLHIALCVDIISFHLEFPFEFIWIFQNIKNKRYQEWDYFWDVCRNREPARTDNSVWEIDRPCEF